MAGPVAQAFARSEQVFELLDGEIKMGKLAC
jgi:hypothetical protein